jgi:hypothetical protein
MEGLARAVCRRAQADVSFLDSTGLSALVAPAMQTASVLLRAAGRRPGAYQARAGRQALKREDEMAQGRTVYRVQPDPDWGWVEAHQERRGDSKFPQQRTAIDRGREMAKADQPSQLFVHDAYAGGKKPPTPTTPSRHAGNRLQGQDCDDMRAVFAGVIVSSRPSTTVRTVTDFDRDGRQDLATANRNNSGSTSVLIACGLAFFITIRQMHR